MLIIGHRGAKGLAPENTIAGLLKAIEHDAHAIEFDVRITNDQVAILNHDTKLSDAAGNQLTIKDHTFRELKAHKPDITTLAEAIIAINHRVPAIVEVKPNEPTGPVIKVIENLVRKGWLPKDITFISFDYQALKSLHAAFPDHQIIIDEMWSSIRAAYRASRLHTKHISLYRPFVWPGFIKAVTLRGYKLYVFTLNDPEQAKRWQESGLHAVITDYPDRFEK